MTSEELKPSPFIVPRSTAILDEVDELMGKALMKLFKAHDLDCDKNCPFSHKDEYGEDDDHALHYFFPPKELEQAMNRLQEAIGWVSIARQVFVDTKADYKSKKKYHG